MSPIAYLLDKAWKRPALWERMRRYIRATGYDTTDWVRAVMYRETFSYVASAEARKLWTRWRFRAAINGCAHSTSAATSRRNIRASTSAPRCCRASSILSSPIRCSSISSGRTARGAMCTPCFGLAESSSFRRRSSCACIACRLIARDGPRTGSAICSRNAVSRRSKSRRAPGATELASRVICRAGASAASSVR